jgi:UDP-N-acetylglucosamine 2-epimerase
MIALERICLEEQPDWIVVFGDINATAAAAMVAAKLQIEIAHIEAGMRSFDRRMPEEINRIIADHLATINFCSTEEAKKHLEAESLTNGIVVGDLMHDLFLKTKETAIERPKKYFLLTLHRAANTDDKTRLQAIIDQVGSLKHPVIFPLHPRTKKMLEQFEISLPDNIRTIEPVGYRDMVTLERHARLILTDSGGVQKEAYWAKVPCVTLRENTEWTETLGKGNVLAKDLLHISTLVQQQLNDAFFFEETLYGRGDAAELIASHLLK